MYSTDLAGVVTSPNHPQPTTIANSKPDGGVLDNMPLTSSTCFPSTSLLNRPHLQPTLLTRRHRAQLQSGHKLQFILRPLSPTGYNC